MLYKRVHHVTTLPNFIQAHLLENEDRIRADELYLNDDDLVEVVTDEAQTLAYILGIDQHIVQLCSLNRKFQNVDKQGPSVLRALNLELFNHLWKRAF